eukprot:Nk52_evm1s2108 gene=Nk52_evmTU1s2108
MQREESGEKSNSGDGVEATGEVELSNSCTPNTKIDSFEDELALGAFHRRSIGTLLKKILQEKWTESGGVLKELVLEGEEISPGNTLEYQNLNKLKESCQPS